MGKKIEESKVLSQYHKTPQDGVYDFYRCYVCGRVFSRAHEVKAFIDGVDDKKLCACGSKKYSPAWPAGLEWLKPSILSYTAKLILARAVAPWCESHHLEFLLPPIERLVRLS